MTPVAWAAFAVGGIGAVANWWSRVRADAKVELVTKPLVTIAMIVAALGIDARPEAARWWFVAGLLGCLAGDVALLPSVDRFIVGLASFLVGHLLFLVGALIIGAQVNWTLGVVIAVVAVAAILAGPRIVRASGPLKPAVGGYLVAISAMAVTIGATGRVAGAVGASAFVVSDTVLGWDAFVGRRKHAPVVIMVTYHLALAGLVLTLR